MKTFLIAVLLLAVGLTGCGKKDATVQIDESLTPTDLLERGNQFFSEGNTQEALRHYGMIYNRYPTSREYIDAVIGLSRCYNSQSDYDKGMDLLYDLLRENMVPTRVPEIYNEMAKYYENNAGISSEAGISDEEQDYKNAIELYNKAISYPNSNDANAKGYAQYRIGELQLMMHNFKEAAIAFKATIHSFPGTNWAQVAAQRLNEFEQAVNTVLNEMKKPADSESIPAAETQVSSPPAASDTSAPMENVLPDTTQTAPQDTVSKPNLEMK